jgi:hypothetical protein
MNLHIERMDNIKNNQKRVHRVGLLIMIVRNCTVAAPGVVVAQGGVDVETV